MLFICILWSWWLFERVANGPIGGADRAIRLWEVNTKVCLQEYAGHRDVVRDIKVYSCDLILSASNDWYVGDG